ncbi:MAG: hypothetical protein GY717_08755 [Rhodobacteraceae bacterium]|nr:hypothetical protein [Paracoccaceae bacterium]
MAKYNPLEGYLKEKDFSRVPMTFREIESVIGDELPPSARKHRAWWSNNPTNSVITYSWLAAGYRTAEVNLEGERVVFVRTENTQPVRGCASREPDGDEEEAALPPIFGCLRGTVTVPAGVDLTLPADPEMAEAVHNPVLYRE